MPPRNRILPYLEQAAYREPPTNAPWDAAFGAPTDNDGASGLGDLYRVAPPVRRVSPHHRLGGPVACVAASFLVVATGFGCLMLGAAFQLGLTWTLEPATALLAVGGALSVAGVLALYGATVAAAVASVEVDKAEMQGERPHGLLRRRNTSKHHDRNWE